MRNAIFEALEASSAQSPAIVFSSLDMRYIRRGAGTLGPFIRLVGERALIDSMHLTYASKCLPKQIREVKVKRGLGPVEDFYIICN